MQKPVVTGWNKPTREYYEVPKARQSKPLSRVKLYGAGVLILAITLSWQGYVRQMAVFTPVVCLVNTKVYKLVVHAESPSQYGFLLCFRQQLSEVKNNLCGRQLRLSGCYIAHIVLQLTPSLLITGWLLYALAGIASTEFLRFLVVAALKKPAW